MPPAEPPALPPRRPSDLLRAIAFDAWFVAVTILLGVVGIFVRLLARQRAADLARLWIRLTLAGLRRIAPGLEAVAAAVQFCLCLLL